MTPEKHAMLVLHLTPGIGGSILRALLSHFGTARAVLNQSYGNLSRISGIGKALSSSILSGEGQRRAETVVARAKELGIGLIAYGDSEYPGLLKEAQDAPLFLFSRGQPPMQIRPLAVVGTRKPSSYGLGFVKELIRELAAYQPCIVSGLAYGIDLSAHVNALENGLATVAVLASGVNIIYPPSHHHLVPEIIQKGSLISEYPPDELPEPGRFPARNRIIAGLTEATIVIEAGDKGGALITAGLANDYNREVFALPGDIGRPFSTGTNKLIRDHQARIITEPSDIVYALGWDQQDRSTDLTTDLAGLNENEQRILRLLMANPELHIDHLSWKSEIPPNRLASVLLNLEFNGFVNSLPGKKYRLAVRRME